MYKWQIKIILKSGKELIAYYNGNEKFSNDVAEKLFAGKESEAFGLSNKNGTENILLKRSEIAVMMISVA